MNYSEEIEAAREKSKRATPGSARYWEAQAARRYWEALARGEDPVRVKGRLAAWRECQGSVEAVRRWEESRNGIG